LKTGDIGKKILANKPKTPSPVKQKSPLDIEQQIDYVKNLPAGESNIYFNISQINEKIEEDEITETDKKMMKAIDKLFEKSPPLKKDIKAYAHELFLNNPQSFYLTMKLEQNTYYKIQINIPKGSQLLFSTLYSHEIVRFPRYSKFEKVNDKEYNYIPTNSPVKQKTPKPQSPKKPQQPKSPKKPQSQQITPTSIYDVISKINYKIEKNIKLTLKYLKYAETINKMIKDSPPTNNTVLFVHEIILNKYPNEVPIYMTARLLQFEKSYKRVNIPKGSHLIFMKLYGDDIVVFPRNSKIEKVNDDEYNYIPNQSFIKPKSPSPVKPKSPSPVKPKSPSPVKPKSPSPQVQSKCKPDPKYSPVKYICNEATGKWVLKTGDIGKKILASKLNSPPQAPAPKPKSVAKKVAYTKEQMYDKFKETFKDDLLGFIGKDKPKFRVATSGGYGVKMTLEEKHGIFGKIITKDIDLTVSVYNSTMDGTECYHYLYNKVMKFIKESGDAKNFKVEVLKMYNSFVPIFKYTRYYIIMIEYKKDEFIDLAITNMNMSDKMIDIPLSKQVGLPIKTEEEYLREFLIFVYMENVPGVNEQVYYKRNPVVGKLPAKGQKDILNSKLLCDKVKKKNYEGYCKLLKEITIEKLKAMPKYERDEYFKSLKMITGQ
jgi:hypothetical protein